MRKWLPILGAAAIALAFYSVWQTTPPGNSAPAPSTSKSTSINNDVGDSRAVALKPSGTGRQTPTPSDTGAAPGASTRSPLTSTDLHAPTQAEPLPAELAGLAPETILENMRTTVRQYGAMFAGNPVGTNPEITQALAGTNPKHISFLKADGNRVNSQGELVDPWGTPYFFHQISGTEMEIRSAGPDRVMYTGDDLVTR